jgi:type III secretion system low calcium response chaperone LcrH/SycD
MSESEAETETLAIGGVEVKGLTSFQKKALEVLGSGGSLKDMRGLKSTDIEAVYSIGFGLYNQAKYEQAEPMFQFACLYSHLEPRYWMALGNCRQMGKKYQPAIDAFGFSYMLDPVTPWPAIQTALCYLGMGNKELASESLTLAERTIAANKPDTVASQRIAALRQAL